MKKSFFYFQGFKYFSQVVNLEKLSIVYVRLLGDNFHTLLMTSFPKLQYLCLRDCPIQECLSDMALGCPFLQEVDLSGDSWVKRNAFLGLSKHPNIRVLRLGHFEHSDSSCDYKLKEFPPKGLYIESVFQNPESFPRLNFLHLEQECSLTYWLDIRIKRLR